MFLGSGSFKYPARCKKCKFNLDWREISHIDLEFVIKIQKLKKNESFHIGFSKDKKKLVRTYKIF